MPSPIKIVAITPDGEEEITQVETGAASIGREPENVIVVDSAAVSRRHACVMEAGSQWVFRDLGSTNGSRVNGMLIASEQMRLLRNGDIIGIADFQMRIQEISLRMSDSQRVARSNLNTSLLIFADDRFVSEFPLQRSGSSFIVGGPQGHVYLSGDLNEQTQLEVHLQGNRLELRAGAGTIPIVVNGNVVAGEASLVDRDEISIGHYQIVINFPESDPELEIKQSRVEKTAAEEVRAAPPVNAYDRPHVPDHMKPPEADGWESESSRRKIVNRKFVFGTSPEQENVSGTLAMASSDFQTRVGFETNASQRFATATFGEEASTRAMSGKFLFVIFVVIVVSVVAIIGLVASPFIK